MLAHRLRIVTRAHILAAAACGLVLIGSGCVHKSAHVTSPVLVPSIEAEPQPPSAPAPAPSQPPVSVQPVTPQKAPQQSKPRNRPKPHKAPPKTASRSEAKPEPAKTNMPDNSVQITADVPRAAVQSQRQNTEQLLRNSTSKLDHLTRRLSDGEQGMARQARNYIAQSNQALETGDIERAYNLAVKASLLTNELAK